MAAPAEQASLRIEIFLNFYGIRAQFYVGKYSSFVANKIILFSFNNSRMCLVRFIFIYFQFSRRIIIDKQRSINKHYQRNEAWSYSYETSSTFYTLLIKSTCSTHYYILIIKEREKSSLSLFTVKLFVMIQQKIDKANGSNY